ncbi:MAG: SDR family oxidoreductase [Chloroflexi bacterium]|nr:SDR family oxidoreductase [Chloroflexota bacterium]
MHGKICIITGATSRIGRETARGLAKLGATVVVIGRNQPKSVATVEAIRQETGNPSIEYLLADLSVQGQIRALADDIIKRYPRIDVLVNNAGGTFLQRQLTSDGIEMTFALNHLAPFLLTHLLLDTLKVSTPSRIVNVSSGSHKQAKMNFDDLQGTQHYAGFQAYGQSKLANLLFTYELAHRLEGTRVTVNALHPGLVATNVAGANGPLVRFIWWLITRFGISAAEGARTPIYLSSAAEVAGVTGRYFYKERAISSSPASNDATAAARLWQMSAQLVGLSS